MVRTALVLMVIAAIMIATSFSAGEPKNSSGPNATVDPLSAVSLHLTLAAGKKELGEATGFVVDHGSKHYLVTNWHVLSGRHPQTNKPVDPSGVVPDLVTITHHGVRLGTWVTKTESLRDTKGLSRWIEHPDGRKVDVVLLPLAEIDKTVKLYALPLSLADTDMRPQVAMPVHIVGFPRGLAGAGGFPIWKTGHIASEPELDYLKQPVFLVDATTRPGMSGSPVLLRLDGGYKTRSGDTVVSRVGFSTRFLGVYAGRIAEDVEVGYVWRPEVIRSILARSEAGP